MIGLQAGKWSADVIITKARFVSNPEGISLSL
jgi:hypothetical protein